MLAPPRALTGPARHGFALLLFCLILFFPGLADRDLWSSHEARAGMNAQGLLDRGSWGLPRLSDGRPELQKPPLYYWLVAGIAWLRGGEVDAWAVRLPAALAATLAVLGLAAAVALGRQRPLAGLLAGVILASAAHFTWLARIGRIDMPLTLCVSVAIGGLWLAPGSRYRFGLQLAAYLALAAGLLLKGPVAVVLPVAVLVVDGICAKGVSGLLPSAGWLRLVPAHGMHWGVPLVAALTLPWFCWAHVHTQGEFTRVFFWYHNVGRALGGSGLRSNPWWFYGPQLLGDFLPWSPLLILGLAGCCRYRILREDAEARLGLVWLGVVLVLLSCSRFKRGDYLLPAYPGAALFLGCLCERGFPTGRLAVRRSCRLAVVGVLAAGMVQFWVVRVYHSLPAEEPYRDYRCFAAEVRHHAPGPAPIVFFRTEAHALAFHLRRPLAVLVQWEELDARLGRAGCHYLVMPPSCAVEAAQRLPRVRLKEVGRNTAPGGSHERPLVLLRARPTVGP
jgi:4-amino-4-deoxy-L-arabinose transferase-like glycosyltransferase